MNDIPDEPTFSFLLPFPGGVNKLYRPVRSTKGAKFIKAPAAERWANAARLSIERQRQGVTIPYRFRAILRLSESNFDADAPTKELFDACQAGHAITNDKHNRGYAVEIDDMLEPGSVIVELYELPDPIPAAAPPVKKSQGNAKKGIENPSIPGL